MYMTVCTTKLKALIFCHNRFENQMQEDSKTPRLVLSRSELGMCGNGKHLQGSKLKLNSVQFPSRQTEIFNE